MRPEISHQHKLTQLQVWMCGGSVVIAECSHVGHIFRTSNPIKWTQQLGNRNYVRVAMVWMDEYKDYYFEQTRYRLVRFFFFLRMVD